MPDERVGNVITGFLCIAYDDLRAAKLLATAGNRNATYQSEQAAEKIILAILTSEGIQGESSTISIRW
jgi:HEPN domain-containing protein